MIERIRATLAALPRRVRQLVPRALAARGRPEPGRSARSASLPERRHLPRRRRAVAAHEGARRRQRGPRAACARTGEPTYFASDVAYLRVQARARLRRVLHRARLRPPRLHRADEGRRGGARRRPGAARDPDAAVRAHRRARRAGVDVQAPRRLHHARRADRARSASTPRASSCSSARTTRRSTSTSTSRASSRPRTPSTTSSTPTRGSRGSSSRSARSGSRQALRARRRPGSSCTRPSASSCASCWRSRPRSPRRPRGARRTGSPPTRSSSRQAFAAFYRDCPVKDAEPEALKSFRIGLSRLHQAHARAGAGPARGQRSRVDVARPFS